MKMFLFFAFLLPLCAVAGNKAKGKGVYKKVNCAMCHKADAMGKAKNGKLAVTKGPQIAGLEAKYIVEQMKAIKTKKRKTKYTSMMVAKIKKLTDKDMKDVAAYVSSLSSPIKGMLEKKSKSP